MKKAFYFCFLAISCLLTQISCSDNGSTRDVAASRQAAVDTTVTTESNSSAKSISTMEATMGVGTNTGRTSEVLTNAKAAEPYLVKAEIVIDFGGDGVDQQTKFETAVYFKEFNHQIASFEQTEGIGDNTRWTKNVFGNRIAKKKTSQ